MSLLASVSPKFYFQSVEHMMCIDIMSYIKSNQK